MSDGTKFVAALLVAGLVACILYVGIITLVFWVFGLGVFAGDRP